MYQQYSLDTGILGLAGIGLFLLGGLATIVGAIAINVLLLPFLSVTVSGLQHTFGGIQTTLNSTTNGLNTVVNGLNTVVGGLNNAVGTLTSAVDTIKHGLSSIPNIPAPNIPTPGIPSIPNPGIPGLFTQMHHAAITGTSMPLSGSHLTAATSLGAIDDPIPSIPPVPAVSIPFSGPDGANGILSALHLPSLAALSQWGQFFLSAGPLAFGSLLLGLTFLRTKLLSHQMAYMFIAVAAIHLICQFLPFRGETFTAALLFLALIWVGYALGDPEKQLFPAQWKLPFSTGGKLQFPWHVQFVTSAAITSASSSSVEIAVPSSDEVSSSNLEEVPADPDATSPLMPTVHPTNINH